MTPPTCLSQKVSTVINFVFKSAAPFIGFKLNTVPVLRQNSFKYSHKLDLTYLTQKPSPLIYISPWFVSLHKTIIPTFEVFGTI